MFRDGKICGFAGFEGGAMDSSERLKSYADFVEQMRLQAALARPGDRAKLLETTYALFLAHSEATSSVHKLIAAKNDPGTADLLAFARRNAKLAEKKYAR